jgi:hypothetical protein
MQLLLEHSQHGGVFRLWAKYELMEAENNLVERYGIKRFILVEGDVRRDRERALKLAGALAVVAFLIGFALNGPPAGVALALVTFVIGAIAIYNNIRETLKVEDIISGRTFSCRSIVTLLEKKRQIGEMGERFARFLELLKNWGGREVIEMAPDRPPMARFVERPRAAE